jgi:sporulation-control protein spo0M
MFGSVKKILGIEGVKLELIIPAEISSKEKIVRGIVKLTSLTDKNSIERIYLKVEEKYSRGRGENKLINEYTLGESMLTEKITINKNDIIEIPFETTFVVGKSEMDQMQDSFITSGIASLFKKINAVQSTFYVRAEADVTGTKLNPFDKKSFILK